MQRTDCCDQPFHCNSSCARSLGLRCAPQCAPCGPPEDTADDWQQRLSNQLRAEREANDRLRAEDPAANEAKMRAQMPTSKCCLCGETFRG
jgi:hypothetical protein